MVAPVPRLEQSWAAFAALAARDEAFPIRRGICRLFRLMGRPPRDAAIMIRRVQSLRRRGITGQALAPFMVCELDAAAELIDRVKALLRVEDAGSAVHQQ